MSLPIKWSPASKDEFAELLNYVETQFGLDAALKLLNKTDKVLDGISEHPEMFPASEKSPATSYSESSHYQANFLALSDNNNGGSVAAFLGQSKKS